MLLEKYENALKFSVEQLVIQSSLVSSTFPRSDYVWCVKNQMLMLFVGKLAIFCIQQEISKSKSNLIPIKK